MTAPHRKKQRHDWEHVVDYETFWILTYSVVVISTAIFALSSIAQSHPYAFP
jgi:hypothetical protein